MVYDESVIDTMNAADYVLFVDSSLLKDKTIEKQLEKFDYFFIENGYPISRMLNFLRVYTFKTHKQVHREFIEKEK